MSEVLQPLGEYFGVLLDRGYIPVLTHPKRMLRLNGHYAEVWKQTDDKTYIKMYSGELSGLEEAIKE